MTKALESQFGSSLFENPMAELFKLQQTGSVSKYYLQFMSLANRSVGLSEDAFFNCFISGLDPDIRRDVIDMTPSTLLRVVALEKLYEKKYNPIVKTIKSNFVQRYSQLSSNTKYPAQAKSVTKTQLPPLLPTPPGPPLKTSNVKRISPAEMQLGREKGLCYFCDDKFTFNLRCPNKQLLLLQMEEEGVDDLGDSLHHDNSVTDLVIHEDHRLSFNALKGGLGIGTIRFLAYMEKLPVTVLIDGGNSDSFLQPRIAKFLKLHVEPATKFKVMVGNGNYMTAEGLVKKLRVQAQGNVFHLPVFLLPIFGADLILGASWLKTIGPHIADCEHF